MKYASQCKGCDKHGKTVGLHFKQVTVRYPSVTNSESGHDRFFFRVVESILTFNIVTFYGHLTVKQKNRLNKIVNIATKLINLKQKSLNDLYQQAISKKSRSIINDPTHPLHSCFEIMPSGKRYRTPAFKRQLYNKSFIPSAVRFLNSQKNL